MTDWQSRLRAAGYTGELELGAMIDALPREIPWPYGSPDDPDDEAQFTLQVELGGDGWRAGYQRYESLDPDASGATREEAVANLMIEHPELWKK